MPSNHKLSPRTHKEVGCEFCPLDKVPDIRKIHGEVNGAELFLWGLAPGREENREGREFVGRSGKLLWEELERIGIKRRMCDIQNVVRCFPTKEGGKMRNPSEKEIRCCSKFTNNAIEKSQAKLHIIFGVLAAKSLLGGEYRKTEKVYPSERLKAQVLCMWHPSYLVRSGCSAGGRGKPNEKLKRWRKDFELAMDLLGRKNRC